MNNLIIRKRRIKDFYPLIKITKESFPFWIKQIPYLFISKVFVAQKNSKIVGFVAISTKKYTAQITLIAVTKDCRDQNIGSLILKQTLNYLNSIKIKSCSSKVRVNNLRALNFYKKNGFEVKKIKKRPLLGDVFLVEKN